MRRRETGCRRRLADHEPCYGKRSLVRVKRCQGRSFDQSMTERKTVQRMWRQTTKNQIPPICILEWKRASYLAVYSKQQKALEAQLSGEMLAVVLKRIEVFGSLTDKQMNR